ncbi:MAG: 4Fe-4S dicluster domain-containing protein [Candidatus Lernaella stagnicola]|nr:4Fe-4S dicluster domain-containing protein [Candidatus Lernaella stagnicola]
MKKRLAMVIDTRRCVGCMDCVIACQTENNVPEGFHRDWIATVTEGRFPKLRTEIRSERCHHCDRPPCVTVCPTGASYKNDDGVVLVDPALCTGCKACVAACPYFARFTNPAGYADKCTFCTHRTSRGDLPACVSVCPTECLHFGDIADPESEVRRLIETNEYKRLRPELGTEPQLYFLVHGGTRGWLDTPDDFASTGSGAAAATTTAPAPPPAPAAKPAGEKKGDAAFEDSGC